MLRTQVILAFIGGLLVMIGARTPWCRLGLGWLGVGGHRPRLDLLACFASSYPQSSSAGSKTGNYDLPMMMGEEIPVPS